MADPGRDEHRFEPASPARIAAMLDEHWGGIVVTPARTYRAPDLRGAFVVFDDREVAMVTWARDGAIGEVVTLDAFEPGHGFGRAALAFAESELAREGATEARLFTTNDNVRAIALYLRAGWRLVRVHLDAMDAVRAIKPDVPLIGENGIPLRDMWEFAKPL
ncbi:MAG: GNAT family N-acetyltransferase [Dehalococcoidia bacterium]